MSQVDVREALEAFAPEPALDGGLFDRVAGGVRRRRRRTGTAVVAAVAAVMLASPLAIYALRAPTPPAPAAASNAARRAATERDVAGRLASLPLPTDARRLPGPPADAPATMTDTMGWPTGPYLVQQTRWYRLSGDLAAGDAWFVGHPPPGAPQPSYSSGPSSYGFDWYWPDVPHRIADRVAEVSAVKTGEGIVLRVDAWAVWVPVRPPDLMIDQRVVSLTVLVHPGMNAPVGTYGPATFTDPARVAAVVSLVNSLPMAVPFLGPVSCPNDDGGTMEVDFTDRSGHLVDRLQIRLSGCGGIEITAADGATGMLGSLDDHSKMLSTVIMSLLGLDWPIYAR